MNNNGVHIELNVCDDCLNIAYDMGERGYIEQAFLMSHIGGEAEDHPCAAKAEPKELTCDCACN